MKKCFKTVLSIALAALLCLNIGAAAVFAEGGSGDGKGKDGGKDGKGGEGTPLELVECSIEDLMEDVPTDNLVITMKFSKNVSSETLRENNTKAITLKADDGQAVDYSVVFTDEKETRQTIEVMTSLEPHTEYILGIDSSLKAHSGDRLADDYEIQFRTGDKKPMPVIEEKDSGSDESGDDSADVKNGESGDNSGNDGNGKGDSPAAPGKVHMIPIAIIMIIAAAVLTVRTVKKNNK